MPKRQPKVTEAEVELAERLRAGVAKLAAKEGWQTAHFKIPGLTIHWRKLDGEGEEADAETKA